MKIEAYGRVVYQNNPLAEVVSQVRFEHLGDLGEDEKLALKAEFAAAGFPAYSEAVSVSLVLQVDGNAADASSVQSIPQQKIYQYASVDGIWCVAVCCDFVGLTCNKYLGWGDFLSRLETAVQIFLGRHADAVPTRIGLRYKDVIEREPLGLDGVPWHELISSFLLGPLAPNSLAENQTAVEDEISNFNAQSLLRLDDAMLLLQSSLLTSIDAQRRAFLIDADFYNEGNLESDLLVDPKVFSARLNALHANAGAMFRRGITERLHHALRPTS